MIIVEQLWVTIIRVGQWFLCSDQKPLWEVSLVILSVLAHILDARQNIWSRILAFPVLFINIYVYSMRRLYGKVLHSIIAILINTYAYINWKGGALRPPVEVSRTANNILVYTVVFTILGTAGWSLVMRKYSNAPSLSIFFDAFYLFFGFIEKWMMSHKKLERWFVAFFRYLAFSIACYHAGSIILCMQQLLLAFVAIYGQIKWSQSYKS
jgi:hypothetical protein